MPPPPRPSYYPRTSTHVHYHVDSDSGTRSYSSTSVQTSRRNSNAIIGIFAVMVVAFFLVVLFIIAVANSAGGAPASTVTRERLNAGSFTSACVRDDIGWIREDGSSESELGNKLQYFWQKTGVQPYVALVEYNALWNSEDARWDYADELYESWVGREDAVLLVYFDAEPDGWWEMVKGLEAGEVLDGEATDIMWAISDRYWTDLNYTVPQAINMMFEKTADRIMEKTTNGWDVMKVMVTGGVVISLLMIFVIWWNMRRKAERERAEETERILQAGQNQATFGSSDPEMDELTSKYDNM